VRNKKTGEIQEIEIENFYNLVKNNKHQKHVLSILY